MLNKNTFPVLLGGDHSCAIGTWSGVGDYILSQGEELSMIWIDAHMDAHRPETSQSGNLHGMPVSHLLGYGHPELTSILTKTPKLKPENLVYFGIRSYEPEEKEFIDKLGIKVYYQDQLNEENFIKLFASEFERLSKQTKHVGISLDLDGLSATEFTAVGTPEEGGVSGETFIKALDEIDFNKLIAFEISEYNPKLDYERDSLAYMIHLIKYLRNRIENAN
jgi:arginase